MDSALHSETTPGLASTPPSRLPLTPSDVSARIRRGRVPPARRGWASGGTASSASDTSESAGGADGPDVRSAANFASSSSSSSSSARRLASSRRVSASRPADRDGASCRLLPSCSSPASAACASLSSPGPEHTRSTTMSRTPACTALSRLLGARTNPATATRACIWTVETVLPVPTASETSAGRASAAPTADEKAGEVESEASRETAATATSNASLSPVLPAHCTSMRMVGRSPSCSSTSADADGIS
mmetsp:Transcript_2656/g.8532  ORF Transcript_2656/g.8532 Transcript_2656/m.8532 type:complete len:247 (+) Transcript_2656:877-1617(+)